MRINCLSEQHLLAEFRLHEYDDYGRTVLVKYQKM